MKQNNIPFQSIDWRSIERTEHTGESGTAIWQTIEYGGLRIRKVAYSQGYMADHWCQKGHIGIVWKESLSVNSTLESK